MNKGFYSFTPNQWPWPSPNNEQISSLLADMQTMNQRLQARIDELNLRLIHLEEVVREFHAEHAKSAVEATSV